MTKIVEKFGILRTGKNHKKIQDLSFGKCHIAQDASAQGTKEGKKKWNSEMC